MSDTEEQKQIYLRENILDKGYEAEDFVTYLTSKKGDEGMNLMNWSLDELKSVVQEYIQNNPLNTQQDSENKIMQPNNDLQNNLMPNPILAQNINNLNSLNNPNMNIPPEMNAYPNILLTNQMLNNNNMLNMNNMSLEPNLLNLQNSNLTNDINAGNVFLPKNDNPLVNSQGEQTDIYGITNTETIYCSFSEQTEFSKHENIKIEIALGEKKPGTFFSKAYQTYVIAVPLLNLKVIRRYSDFEWLRQILVNIFSSSVIPPIPKKNKLGGDRFNEEFLEKRTRTLEKFLNLLNKDPIIRSSQLFYDFLSIEELNKFYEMKKHYNNYKLPQNLKEYKSLNGQLDIKVDDSREIFYQNIKDQTEINQELLSKLNKQFKLLNNEMNMVVSRLEEIAKNCEELFLHSVKYNSSDDIKISYYELNEMFKHWSTALRNQNSLTYINIREHFKFTKNVFKSMKDLINSADNCKQAYYKSKRNLISKKEELFRKGDITKWDLGPNKNINTQDKTVALPNMLVNETNSVINLKQIYGYYLNSVNNEFERTEKIFAFGHKQNLIENAKKEITIISELFKNISDIAVGSPKYSIDNIMKQVNTIYNKNEGGNS
jgi:hypothetical protein